MDTAIKNADRNIHYILMNAGIASPPEKVASYIWSHPVAALCVLALTFIGGAFLSWLIEKIWKNLRPGSSQDADTRGASAHNRTAYQPRLQLMFLRPRLSKQRRAIWNAISPLNKVGGPMSNWALNPIAVQGVFEHAAVIWTPNPRRFYAINESGTAWWSVNDTHSGDDDWTGLNKRTERLAKFNVHGSPPSGYHPPFGGWALYMDRNPGEWPKYGWQQWHCLVRDTLYREYENAHVFGVYPISPNSTQGRVIILYKDGSLEIVEVGTSVKCEESAEFRGDKG